MRNALVRAFLVYLPLALVGTVLAARVVLQGSLLGRVIGGALPKNRGVLSLGGVHWTLRAIPDLVTDAPTPIEVDGLKIVDAEGVTVLDVPHLSARVKLRTLIGGSFSISQLRAGQAFWRFAALKHAEGIGFLDALAPREAKPEAPKPKPEEEGPGGFFALEDAALGDLTVQFDFPGAWGLELRHAKVHADLRQSSEDPRHPTFGFVVSPVVAEGGGFLRVLDDVLPFDRVEVREVSTRPERPDDIFLDLPVARTGRSVLSGKGYFTGIYGATSVPGIDLAASFRDADDALNAVVAGRKIEGLVLGGAHPAVDATLKDPFAKLKVKASFSGLDVTYAPYKVTNVGFGLSFDGGAMKVGVDKFSATAPGGGVLALDATLDATKLKLEATPRFERFTTTSYLPAPLRALAGGRLSGKLAVAADLAGSSLAVNDLDLRLARTVAAGLPGEVRLRGSTQLSPRLVKTRGLEITVAGARASAHGEVALARKWVEAGLEVVAWDLGKVLASFGVAAGSHTPASRASFQADAKGSLENPDLEAKLEAENVGLGGRRAPRLTGALRLHDGVAELRGLGGALLGGTIQAQGKVALFQGRLGRPLREPRVDLDVEARELDLTEASGLAALSGKLSFSAHAHGTLAAPAATFKLAGPTTVRYGDETLEVGPVDVAFDGRVANVRRLQVRRPAGGSLLVTGTVDVRPVRGPLGLALDVALEDVPLSSLPGIAQGGIPVKGLVSLHVAVRGTPERPQLEGALDIKDARLRETELGSGHIAISTDPDGRLRAKGQLIDHFTIDGDVGLGARGPSVHGVVAFDELALEAFLPEILALGEGNGRVSGQVEVAFGPGKPLSVDAFLSELWLSLSREVQVPNGGATQQRVDVRATKPIHAHVEGESVRLDELVLATAGGELRASGSFDADTLKLGAAVNGHLDLELLQPFLHGTFDRLGGNVTLGLTVAGSSRAPSVAGSIAISSPVRMRPTGFEAEVAVQRGTIELSSQRVNVRDLAIAVDGAVVTLNGATTIGPSFRPGHFDVGLEGELSARLLGALAPDVVEDARGRARVKASLGGTLDDPRVDASLDLGEIHLRPRDFSADLFVRSGVVKLSNEGASLEDVRIDVDQQGRLTIGQAGQRPGRIQFVSLRPFVLGGIDFPLHGEQLSYRTPAMDIADLQCDLNLTGDLRKGLDVNGEIRLLAGRYLQDFKVADLVLSPRVDESAVEPFYEGKPLLEDLGLALTVRTVGDAFVVQNNLAPEIHLDVLLNVSGTLSEPAIGGEVRPTDGRFNIPGFRADFELVANANHVNFVPTKSLADGDTPDIYLEAQSLVPDVNGQDHNVRLRISGPVRQMQMDLSTDTGLDRNQTAILLLTGRTTTGTQRFATSNPTVGANVNSSADIAGQITRDTVANLIQPLIGNAFERALNVDLRFTIGPDGVQARLRKRMTRRLFFQIDRLQGFQNQYHQTVTLNWLVIDYTSLVFFMQQLQVATAQGTESVPTAYNLELRWDFAIRR